MFDKNFIGVLSLIVAILGYVPYVVTIFNGRTRPHAFSWVIWTIAVMLAFVAQISRGAGHGAWVTGVTAAACVFISALALWRGERHITRSDEVFFGLTLAAIPLWVVTKEPLWSVLLMVVINNVGFIPTFRKTYRDPYSENVPFFVSVVVKFALGILALDHITPVTLLFPLNCALVNAIFIAMIYWRRHELHQHAPLPPGLQIAKLSS